MLQGDLLDNVLEDLRKLLYIPVLTIWSDELGNIEGAADSTPENDDSDELEGGNIEDVLPSRTSEAASDPVDDEDIEAGIVNDPLADSALADVKLATTVREVLFSLIS
jgi:hypothetical protein